MRLVYLTSGPRERLFDALLAAGHEITLVVTASPEKWPKVKPTLERARDRGIPVCQVKKSELEKLGAQLAGQICLSAGFAFILPPGFLRAVAVCFNVHGTLLPRYAGGNTLNWVIANGERESGVTVHVVDEGVDTGPVLLQRSFPVSRFDTGASLARKTLELEPEVVLNALELYERHGMSMLKSQDLHGIVRHPDRQPEHSQLDPTRPLIELYDKIRASDPERYPAFFTIDGQKVCIRVWRPEKPADEADLI